MKNKHLIYFALSILLALIFVRTIFFDYTVDILSQLSILGILLSGVLFASTITFATALMILVALSETYNPLLIALVAAIGTVGSDLIFFKALKSHAAKDFVKYANSFEAFRQLHVDRLIKKVFFRWLAIIFGVLIIILPLPDEAGVSLLGLAHLKQSQFIILAYILNFIGIYLVLLVF